MTREEFKNLAEETALKPPVMVAQSQAFKTGALWAFDTLASNWISVKDSLPEITEPLIGYNDKNVREVMIENFEATVLAYNPELGIYKAKLHKWGWTEVSSVSSKSPAEPTHWQPLPEPPIT